MFKLFALLLSIFLCAITLAAQQSDHHASLNEAAVAVDANGAAVFEARLATTVLNGSQDSPVTNLRLVVKNTTANFYNYVTGWVTFYDSGAVRCGEGLFKVDALAPNESSETDAPGIRVHCSPASWRVVASNSLVRSNVVFQPGPPAPSPPPEAPVEEKRQPVNFIISIDGEEHPIQVNNPIVLKLANRNRKIVLKPAQ